MTKIIITGAKGKMGQALLRVAEKNPVLAVAARIDRGQELGKVIQDGDVVIDFTGHEITVPYARLCAQHKKAMVIGTTGHTDAQRQELLNISTQIPMVWSSNFSTGVNALFWLTGKAVEILGADYDLDIVEMHHRLKKDPRSGTAQTLAQILARAQQRPVPEIPVHSLRGGDVVGDHTVIFSTTGERLELTHKASSRETFAGGALRAAQWVIGKPPGVYDMQDVLGLK
jgi:4-hydroxy-tetrahydrodipicolinate reductase